MCFAPTSCRATASTCTSLRGLLEGVIAQHKSNRKIQIVGGRGRSLSREKFAKFYTDWYALNHFLLLFCHTGLFPSYIWNPSSKKKLLQSPVLHRDRYILLMLSKGKVAYKPKEYVHAEMHMALLILTSCQINK